jgi:hypothetical protein
VKENKERENEDEGVNKEVNTESRKFGFIYYIWIKYDNGKKNTKI